jgi:hypothetical protein
LTNRTEKNKLKPYKFGYEIQDEKGNVQHRHEQSDGNRQTGSYGYVDANGIFRKVYYIADENGFRVKMDSNEPGIKDVPLGDAISKQSSESSFASQPPSSAGAATYHAPPSVASDERKAASSSLPVSDRDWVSGDMQRVRSQSPPFPHNQGNAGPVPDSRIPLQYASPSTEVSRTPNTSSYPMHFLTSNLPAYSAPSSDHESSSLPKYSDSADSSRSASHARHRPQYDRSSDPASSHPPHAYPSASSSYAPTSHVSDGASPSDTANPNDVNSPTLYIRDTPVSGHLSNRPSPNTAAYPPYEYQYQLPPSRSPIVQPSYGSYRSSNDYAPPLPSPKPYEPRPYSPEPSYRDLSSAYRANPTQPRKHRLLADSGLISVHGLDDNSAPPPSSLSLAQARNHSHYSTEPHRQPSPSYPIDRPSVGSYASAARPQIDYDRYRQLIRSKLPARNLPYRHNLPTSAHVNNYTERPSHSRTEQPSYEGHGSPSVDSSDPNAPLFMSRYSSRDPISSKHYYDRFKQAEFASFRPQTAGQSTSTSGRSADYRSPTVEHDNTSNDHHSYRPSTPAAYDTYSNHAPSTGVHTAHASPPPSSHASMAPSSYHSLNRPSSAPHYDRPHSYDHSAHMSEPTTVPPTSGHIAPAYTYSLAPPSPSVTPSPSPASTPEQQDNDLYNPQGAVQLSIKKRIANRHQNRPFAGRVHMNWPSVAAASRSSGYIRADPSRTTNTPVASVDPHQTYRYEASNQQPTFNQFKSGLKQLLPLLGSESALSNSTQSTLSRNARTIAHAPSHMPFDRSDVMTYKDELPVASSNFRLSNPSTAAMTFTNGSEPQASASNSVANLINSVRTSSLVKAIPLGRVQMSQTS